MEGKRAARQPATRLGEPRRAALPNHPSPLAARFPICAPQQSPNQAPYADSQCRDHRPCRPWQDHAGRSTPAPVRLLPGPPAGGRARARPQRAGAGAWHHHPGQVHVGPLAGRPDQHRGHPRPCRFRRRGGTHPEHGGRRHRPGGRRRGRVAADQVRGRQGAGPRPAPDRRGQQGGPFRRPRRRGPHRDLRLVRGTGRHRQPARLPDAVCVRPPGLGRHVAGRPPRRPVGHVRPGGAPRAAAVRRSERAVRHGGVDPGIQFLPRPGADRAGGARPRPAEHAGEGAASGRPYGGNRPHDQAADLPRPGPRPGGGSRGGRHHRRRRPVRGDRAGHHRRTGAGTRRCRRSRWTLRRSP